LAILLRITVPFTLKFSNLKITTDIIAYFSGLTITISIIICLFLVSIFLAYLTDDWITLGVGKLTKKSVVKIVIVFNISLYRYKYTPYTGRTSHFRSDWNL